MRLMSPKTTAARTTVFVIGAACSRVPRLAGPHSVNSLPFAQSWRRPVGDRGTAPPPVRISSTPRVTASQGKDFIRDMAAKQPRHALHGTLPLLAPWLTSQPYHVIRSAAPGSSIPNHAADPWVAALVLWASARVPAVVHIVSTSQRKEPLSARDESWSVAGWCDRGPSRGALFAHTTLGHAACMRFARTYQGGTRWLLDMLSADLPLGFREGETWRNDDGTWRL